MSSLMLLADFKRLDKIIRVNLPTWQLVNDAFGKIYEGELWKAKFPSWKDYLDDLGVPQSTGYKQLTVYRKRQAEQLLIDTGQKRMEDSKLLNAKTLGEALTEGAKDNKREPVTADTLGIELPMEVQGMFDRADEVHSIVHALQLARRTLEKAQADKDLLWAETEINSALAGLGDVIRQVKTALPYAVCPYCQGKTPKSCDFCHHRGVVSKFRFSTADPDLVKLHINNATKP